MMPEGTRVLRKERRKAWRGTSRGRRSTHQVRTTYGKGQRDRDWREAMSAAVAAFRVAQEASDPR